MNIQFFALLNNNSITRRISHPTLPYDLIFCKPTTTNMVIESRIDYQVTVSTTLEDNYITLICLHPSSL